MALSGAELRHWLIQQPEGTQPPATLGGGQGFDFKAFSDPAGSARESPAQGIPSARLTAAEQCQAARESLSALAGAATFLRGPGLHISSV